MLDSFIIKNEKIILSDIDLSEIYKVLNFEKKGLYFNFGRTCYIKLKHPVIYNGIEYGYIKIKGAGVFSEKKTFEKPGLKSFEREDPHFSINNDGSSNLVFSDIAPYGGLLLSRAFLEYNNFESLYKAGVSTLLPYAVYEYKELKFNKDRMGVSLALCEKNNPYRFNMLLNETNNIPEKYLNFYKKVFYNEFNYNADLNFDNKIKLINKIAYKYAKEIRKFGEQGFYIHSGGWSNIQYSFNNKNIVLIDLDSSRKIDNEQISLLLICRDLISNIYRLLINLYNPNCIKEYNDFIIKKSNYVYSLLSGFFEEINSQELNVISDKINNFYIKECFNKIKNIEHIMLDIPQNEVKLYELDILKFYDFCMNLIYPLALKSNSKHINSCTIKLYKSTC